MTQASDIGWSSYDLWEGPFFLGKLPYAAPSNPDFGDKCVSVVTATEGGHFDAINMYDSCVLSVGIIQVCERVSECSNMLGACWMRNRGALLGYLAALPVPLTMTQSAKGLWRLSFADIQAPVQTPNDMARAYLGGATGKKGQWTDSQKEFAKQVAAGFATIWEHPDMRAGQLDFIKPRLTKYVMPRARAALFADPSNDGWSGAIKAAYISYSANIPAVADKCLAAAMADPKWASSGPQDRFLLMTKAMVHSGVGIWPNRYRAIQPALSKLFGVNAPSLEVVSGMPTGSPQAPPTTDNSFATVKSIQQFLIAHGYDLGPTGADGIFGTYTKNALMKFQGDHHLTQTGYADDVTRQTMKTMAAAGQ